MPDHIPVLLTEVIDLLDPKIGETYLDVTAGKGGHAREIAKIIGQSNLTLVDADPQVVASLKQEFAQATLYNNNFADQVLEFRNQNRQFDMILADLGVSSMQLNAPNRGFSFQYDGPLDMRLDNRHGFTLQALLDHTSEAELTSVLREYGQEKAAKRISQLIKSRRPQTTLELAQIVARAKSRHFYKKHLHPATQVFMALRIWTNDELGQLAKLLQIAPLLLKPAGRLAIISFHSLEDRLVKRTFRDLADGDYDASYFMKNKKPIISSDDSLSLHPQARSAKLRILQRY